MATRGVSALLVFVCLSVFADCLTPTTVLTIEDQEKLRQQLVGTLPNDLETVYYTVASLRLLNAKVPSSQEICAFVNSKVDSKDITSIYYATSVEKLLDKCHVKLPNVESVLNAGISEKSHTQTIRYAVEGLANLGKNVNVKATSDALKSILKAESEEFVPSATNALFTASFLSGDVSFAFDLIEDAVAQADEIADIYLQFDAGFKVTSDFVAGVYALAEHMKKAPAVTEDQAIKFANYLLSRKYIQRAEDTFFLLKSLIALSDNQFQVPVITRLYSSAALSQTNQIVKVRVTNTLDKPFEKMSVKADTITGKDEEELCSNKAFTAEKDLYQLDLMSFKPSAGFYKAALSVKPAQPDARLIGLSGIQLSFKVVTKVSLGNVAISVVDKEHASLLNSFSVNYPHSLDKAIAADNHQKVTMTFSLKDQMSGEIITAHQTFVRLVNAKTNQEIFFVAEPESTNEYKFDLDVGASAKDSFGSLSGEYEMELLIGDGAIENALAWTVGSLKLTFADTPAQAKQEKGSQFKSKPIIEHLFRQPEKRPPKTVSSAFTVLVVLPLLILLIAWLKLGVNFSNFQFSLSAIVFHVGLGGIFFLMYAFWATLNMFSTLKLLALIGTVTFLGGNNLLANMAAQRTKN